MEIECHCRQRQETREMKNTLEFKDGLPQSYIQLKNNSIRTAKYSIVNCVPLLVYEFSTRIGNLYLIICIILSAAFPTLSPYSVSIFIFPFLLSLAVYIAKELFIDRKFKIEDAKINALTTKVCRDDKINVMWGDLCVGDVVYLERGDTVPADILLLDSQQLKHRSAITYVATDQITGCNKIFKKKAAYLTQLQYRGIQKNNWSHYRQMLSGKVTYENPTSKEQFHAYLKLTKDPKVEQLTIENLIPRGSVIKTSLWIFGLVIYAGEDTKIMQMNKDGKKNKKPNLFTKLSTKIILYNIILNAVISILFLIVHISNTPQVEFLHKALHYFLLFSVLCSSIIYSTMDIIGFLISRNLEESLKIKINNPEVTQELGCIDCVVMGKMGVIATGQYIINEIMTPSCMYKVYEMTECKPRNSKRIGCRTLGMLDIASLALTEKPTVEAVYSQSEQFQIDDQNFGVEVPSVNDGAANAHYDQLEPLVMDRIKMVNNVKIKEKQSYDSILSMALCHEAKFIYNHKKDDFKGISHNPIEELLLRFCQTMGIKCRCHRDVSQQNFIEIVCDDNSKEMYEIVGAQEFQFQRKRFSIVCRRSGMASIICKGQPESMMKIIQFKPDERAKIEAKLAQYRLEGIQPIIYAKKALSAEEIACYESEYMSVRLALNTTEKEIDQFTNKYETQLQFVCMVAINDELATGYKEFVTHLTKCDIKYGIMTSDGGNSTINVSKKLLAQSFQAVDYIHLDIGTKEQIKYQISQTLTLMKNKKGFSYVIVMNQQTADIVLDDSDCLQHFIYLLYESKSFIGYALLPTTIGRLIQLLKDNSPSINTVMALGYGYYNIDMLSHADVGIGMGELQADINIQDLSQAIQLIKHGPASFSTSLQLLSQMVYRIGVIRCVMALYECVTYDYMNSIIEGTTVWVCINIFTILGMLIKMIYGWASTTTDTRQKYAINTILKKNLFRHCLLSVYIESVIHGSAIMLSTYFILPRCTYGSMHLFNNFTENTILMLQILLTSMSRLILFRRKALRWYSTIIIFTINICIYFICLALVSYIQNENIAAQFYKIVLSYDSFTLIIHCLFFNIAFTYISKTVLAKKFFPLLEVKEEVQDCLAKNFKNQEDKQLIQKLFGHVENIDPNILEIMNDIGIDSHSIKFNRFGEFRNEPLNHKFNFEQNKLNQHVEFNACNILLCCLVTQIILSLLQSNWSANTPEVIYFICSLVLVPFWLFYQFVNNSWLGAAMIGWIVVASIGLLAQKFRWPLEHYNIWLCLLSVVSGQLADQRLIVVVGLAGFLYAVHVVVLISPSQVIVNSFFVVIYSLILFIFNANQFKEELQKKKRKFLNEETFKMETDHAQDILSLLVPKFVHKYIKDGDYNLQQAQNDVSVLFCYVCNFDTIVKEEGKNVVHLMDQLFRQFDQLCHNYAVQKIETVGMTYMGATGITAWQEQFDNSYTNKNSVERLLKMSIAMLEKSKGIMYGKNKDKKLTIKIGIHTGKVVIGVIGYHKPQFSLIGDTVNTTSRHCSTAKQGQIVLSNQAFKKLKYKESFFEKNKAEMKGLGVIDVYKWKTSQIGVGKESDEKNKRFRKAVKTIIENLIRQGKIVKKPITQRLAQALRSTKPKRSEKITSMQSVEDKVMEPDQIKEPSQEVIVQPPMDHVETKKYQAKKYSNQDIKLLVIQAILLASNTFYELWLININIVHLVLRLFSILLICVSICKYQSAFSKDWLKNILLLYQLIVIWAVNAEMFYIAKPSMTSHLLSLWKVLWLTLFSSLHLFILGEFIVVASIGYAIPWFFAVFLGQGLPFHHDLVLFAFYCGFLVVKKHRNRKLTWGMVRSIQSQDKQKREQEALVSQLLPKHAFLKLRNQNLSNKIELTDQIEGATLLFADIKGFTSYSNQNSPQKVVDMLRQLFEQFDKTCLKFNVYKVYTIGDCYVVLGFTNPFQRDIVQEAKNVVNMGLAMVDIVHTVRRKIDFEELDMRIGIHTGTIIGGIIGTDIVRYDIYGRDVMIANKFEEYGKTGAVHISSATKAILDMNRNNNFKMVPNGTVKIEKLNVQIAGYLVSRKKFE